MPDANAATPRVHVYDARGARRADAGAVVRRRHRPTGCRRARSPGTDDADRHARELTGAGARRLHRRAAGRRRAALSGRLRARWSARAASRTAGPRRAASRRRCAARPARTRSCRARPRRIVSTYLGADELLAALVASDAHRRRVGVCRRSRDVELPRRLPGEHRAPARRSGDDHRAGSRPGLRRGLHGVRSAAPAGRRRPDRRALVAVRFVRGRHGRDPDAGGGGRRRGARRSAGGRHRGAARRPRTPAGGRAAGCASSITIRRPTRWGAAR